MVIRINKNVALTQPYFVLVAIFFILKTARAFSGSNEIGGIWNYIQIFFVVVGTTILIINFKKIINEIPGILWLVGYSTLSLITSIIFLEHISLSSFFALLKIPYFLSVFIVFYYCGQKRELRKPTILRETYYVIMMIVIYNLVMYYMTGGSKGAIADVYYGLTLLPLVLIYTNKKRELMPIIFLALALLLTQKRAGIIALLFMLMALFLYKLITEKKAKELFKKVLSIVAVICLLGAIIYVVATILDIDIISRMMKLATDGGSGRSSRWQKTLALVSEQDALHIILGMGKNKLNSIVGAAHNDFLQILYDHGIIATLFYICFYISMFNVSIKMLKKHYQESIYFILSLIGAVFLAMFSFFVIDATYATGTAITLGLILSDYNKKKKQGFNSY